MAIPPIAPTSGKTTPALILGKTKLVSLLVLFLLFVLCLAFSWNTRGAMANLSFLRGKNKPAGLSARKTLVDITPWQTAEALAALAVTAEETEYAQDAERLADHEVDQAFASALRQARLNAAHRTLSGDALALSQKVAQLQQLVTQDQELVKSLSPPPAASTSSGKNAAPPASADSDDLDVAKAQLGLDSDELADAQTDLDRASGDDSSQIQEELTAHEAAMQKYDNAPHTVGQIAVVSVSQHGTLAGRISAWFKQLDRYKSIVQAQQQAQQDSAALTAQHNSLEQQANANEGAAANTAGDHASRITSIKNRSAERQVLSIYDDRIQTQQQLEEVYGKWAAQVMLQHTIVMHLILQSFAVIILIVICILLCDTLVRHLMARPSMDKRQTQTLRSILQLGIQVVGGVLILLVIFGVPQETPTILGLVTAGITIVMQDFILAFFGWFVLVGKNGMHVGDWVEINGVGGEVTEVGLFSTSLLETGTLEDKGHPTGRRTSFMNGFAIRGQYFNFSTTGQWMWDEISVTIPATDNVQELVQEIHDEVEKETAENTSLAEAEWKRAVHGDGLSRFTASPVVNLRPSSSGIATQVRYVTRASQRFDLRNRLYQRIVDMLQKQGKS